MALGQLVGTIASVAAGNYLDVRPSSGEEWVIHNFTADVGTNIEIYQSNGVSEIKVDEHNASIVDVHFHASTTLYYRIKNVSGATANLGYDGVIVYEG